MHLTPLLLLSLLPLALTVPSTDSPPYIDPTSCTNPPLRKEWRQLTISERKSYTNAVVCLYNLKPTRLAHLVGVDSEYAAFTGNHKTQTPWVHMTGLFLPWHRLFIREYERTLQELCGYEGVQPYWDYTIDSGPGRNFTLSPVFDPEHGFGGNGKYDRAMNARADVRSQGTFWGGGCVQDGPFKDFKFVMRRGKVWTEDAERCLSRNLWESFTQWTEQRMEDVVLKQESFADMSVYLEGPGTGQTLPGWPSTTIHAGGHFIVGGLPMDVQTGSDPWTSVLEPLFWMHHTNLDRIWWEWQEQNEKNLWGVGLGLGSRAPGMWGPEFTFVDEPMTWDSPVDLTDDFGGPRNKVKIANLLSTAGKTAPNGAKSVLCYNYSKSPKPGRV